jgi:hypothetical protein
MSGGRDMSDAEIDCTLSRQDEILPSSGFAASVMDAVRREAAAPPPIPFPWKRALPVLALAMAAVMAVVVAGIAVFTQFGGAAGPSAVAVHSSSPSAILSSLTLNSLAKSANSVSGWTGLALLLSLISAKLSMRLAGVRS